MSTAQSGSAISPFHRFPFIIGNIRIPMFFKFTQNPNQITVDSRKEFKQTKTIGGYVFEHWGKQPTMMKGQVLIKKDSSITNLIGLNTKTTNFGIEDVAYNAELSTFKTLYNIDQRKLKDLGDAASTVADITTDIVAGVGATQNMSTIVTAGLGAASQFIKGIRNIKVREPSPATLVGYKQTLTDTIIIYKGVIYSGFFTSFSYTEDGKNPFYNIVNFEFLVTNTTEDWLDTILTQTEGGRALSAFWGATNSITTLGSMISNLFKDTGKDTNGHI